MPHNTPHKTKWRRTVFDLQWLANTQTECSSAFAEYIFDIGYPWYGQLTPVRTRYPLTSITWPYHGLRFRPFRGQLVFLINHWPDTGFWLDRRLRQGQTPERKRGLFFRAFWGSTRLHGHTTWTWALGSRRFSFSGRTRVWRIFFSCIFCRF